MGRSRGPGRVLGGSPDGVFLSTGQLILILKKRKFSLGIDRAAPQGRVL